MDCEVGVVSLVSKERRHSGSCARSVIVCEFCEWKEVSPVVLLIVAINSEVLLQCLVRAFCLSISFGVMSGREMKLHVQGFSQGSEEVRNELGTTIGSDVGRYSMLGKHVKDEELGELSGGDGVVRRNKYRLFRKTVDDDED